MDLQSPINRTAIVIKMSSALFWWVDLYIQVTYTCCFIKQTDMIFKMTYMSHARQLAHNRLLYTNPDCIAH